MKATVNLTNTLEAVKEIAYSAGELLREAYSRPRRIEHKGTVDLVTQADRASESYIINALQAAFPDYAIMAEEGGAIQAKSDYTWLIDPLDGTTNFAHGFPVFAVSIALCDARGVLLGVVYDPLRDECFAAARGQGTTLNGEPVHVSAVSELRAALLATGFPYDRQTAEDNNTTAFATFLRRAQGVRRAGAAALDLAYVACGRLDGYWEPRLHGWDVAAGVLLVREAGGVVTPYDGSNNDELVLSGQEVVASNGHIHAEMIATLGELYGWG